MLQPMQPIGQQQRPGTNMPQAPGQQTMPAGAAFQRGILPGGIASNPEDIKAAYGGTPQGQQKLQQSAQQGDYLSAIALAQILEEERERASAKAAQGGKPQPVVDRMRDEAVELRRQDLEEQQAKRLGMEQQRSQAAMAQMVQQGGRPPMQGIAQLPAQNVAQPQAMAAGGIVAFGDGGDVERKMSEEEVRPVGADPYAGMSTQRVLERFGRQQLGTNREEAERRAREEYAKYGGYTPEERAAQEKRIAQLEAYDREMYDPEKLRNEGLIAALAAGSGVGSIGQVLGNVGVAGLNYDNKMRELARQRMEGRHKKAEDWLEAQRGARVKGYEAGVGEGKEVLQGQRYGASALGDVLQAQAAQARLAQSGGGAENRAQRMAAEDVARDEYINILKSELTDMRKAYKEGTPEYRAKLKQVFDREAAIYKKYPGAVPPTAPTFEEPPAAAPKEESKPWFRGVPEGSNFGDIAGGIVSSMFGGRSAPQQGDGQAQAPTQSAAPSEMLAGAQFAGYAKGTNKRVYKTPDGKMYTEQ